MAMLTAGGGGWVIPTPARMGELGISYLQDAPTGTSTHSHQLAPQLGMQSGRWNRTEGASTPPLSPGFPNDGRGKFTSRGRGAFRWIKLTPGRWQPSLASPLPHGPGVAFLRTLKPANQAWTTCTAASRRDSAPHCPGGVAAALTFRSKGVLPVRLTRSSGSEQPGTFRRQLEACLPRAAAFRLCGRASRRARSAGVY